MKYKVLCAVTLLLASCLHSTVRITKCVKSKYTSVDALSDNFYINTTDSCFAVVNEGFYSYIKVGDSVTLDAIDWRDTRP